MPWFIGGDFNEILSDSEKHGGRIGLPRQMNDFNLTLTESGLSDLSFEGYLFTWSNNRETPRTDRCQLDLVCANFEAICASPTAIHVQQHGSDHLPIVLHFDRPLQRNGGVRRMPFTDCESIIRKE